MNSTQSTAWDAVPVQPAKPTPKKTTGKVPARDGDIRPVPPTGTATGKPVKTKKHKSDSDADVLTAVLVLLAIVLVVLAFLWYGKRRG